jgi:hypothetical protein
MDDLDPELRRHLERHFGALPPVDWARKDQRIRAAAADPLGVRAFRRRRERIGELAIRSGLAAALLLGAAAALVPDGQSDQAVVEDVGSLAASDQLPADPLFVTDQATFLTAMTEPAER